jgi:alkaline phosphatase
MTIAYGTAQLNGSQQHTGTQLRVAGYGPGAANVVGLSDQTDVFTTVTGALSGVGLDQAPAPQTTTVTRTVQVPPARTVAFVAHKISTLAKQVKKASGAKKVRLKGQLAAYKAIRAQLR